MRCQQLGYCYYIIVSFLLFDKKAESRRSNTENISLGCSHNLSSDSYKLLVLQQCPRRCANLINVQQDMVEFSEVFSDFALKLFKQVSVAGQNSIFSPASITTALAMTYAGADGNTKSQMNKALFSGLKDDRINESIGQLVKVINEPVDGYVLRTANRIYCEKSYQLLQTFVDTLQKHYQSESLSVDFAKNADHVRQEINKWVEQTTNNKITNLLPPNLVNSMTRLVLVNAIYFKGDWKRPFEESGTLKKPFYISSTNFVEVEMMHGKHKDFKYGEDEMCQVLGIPYKSPDVAMFFILPKERNGLAAFEQKLTGRVLNDLCRNVSTGEVQVELPKFKLEQMLSLADQLTSLGITDMFSGDANFMKISGSKDLYVSSVVHKAFIEVNEKGAEAAAATGVVMMTKCAMPRLQNHVFKADHPFLFAIVERKMTSVLFLGHYYGN